MTRLEFVVPGRVDTNHRPRASIRGGKVRTHKAAGYRDYVSRARLYTQAAVSAHFRAWERTGRFAVVITAHEHDARSRDCDNLCKGILDAMTGVVWDDDRQVDDLRVIRGEVRRTAPCVRVEVVVILEEAGR